MRKTAVFRTTGFRFTLFYLALFAGSAFAFLLYVYLTTAGYLYRVSDEALYREEAVIEQAFASGGVNAVNAYIISQTAKGGDELYVLLSPDDDIITGAITRIPDRKSFDARGFVRFTYDAEVANGHIEPHAARGHLVPLADGYTVFVAIDLGQHAHFIVQILKSMWWGAAVVLVLGLIGGLWLARRVDKRFQAFNRVMRDARGGNLSARMPASGTGDEYETMGQNLNAMLMHIEEQTAALKYAGDAMAHDLRTPMTRLKTGLEKIDSLPKGQQTHHINGLVDEADKVLNIFSGILSLSRLEARKTPPDMGPMDLADVMDTVIDLYGPVCDDAGINLVLNIGDNLQMNGSPSLLSQVFTNIFDNALKYAVGADTIQIDAIHNGDQIAVTVSDNGPGIPAEARSRIFDRFVRLDDSRMRAKGTGLGLSLVRAIMSVHNGQVQVKPGLDNTNGGQGVCVDMILPAQGVTDTQNHDTSAPPAPV